MMSQKLQQRGVPIPPEIPGVLPGSSEAPVTLETQGSGVPAMATTSDKQADATLAPLQNTAATSKSPYVLSQKDSKINWQLYGPETIQRAKVENKPIFLHIGYSASYHCYLTACESFTNQHVIKILNDRFIPVIVDREERPDLDAIYTNYIISLNSAAGHPLNVFLTPELEPVFGGTYWPAPGSQQRVVNSEGGEELADFLVILEKVDISWTEQEGRVRLDSEQSVARLREMAEGVHGPSGPTAINTSLAIEDQLEQAYSHIFRTFDYQYGGFIHFPTQATESIMPGNVDVAFLELVFDHVMRTARFLLPTKLSFLLQITEFPQWVIDLLDDKDGMVKKTSDFAFLCLEKMLNGGVYDQVGDGFHRGSATRDWSLPMFEKTLVDNALMLDVILDAWKRSSQELGPQVDKAKDRWAEVVLLLGNFLAGPPFLQENGGFATSEAAGAPIKRGDEALRHGAYYVWTRKEFESAIGDVQQSSVLAACWDVRTDGNVESAQDPNDEFLNHNVLHVVKEPTELSTQFGIPQEEVSRLITAAKPVLRAYRDKERVPPPVDDKVVTAYNGIAIGALARAASTCEELSKDNTMLDHATKYRQVAIGAAKFVKAKLWDESNNTLYRFYRDGRSDTPGLAGDYAFMIRGLLALFTATQDETWLSWAEVLQETQIKLFYDARVPADSLDAPATGHRSGGFYTTQADAQVLLRLKDAMDTTMPSTNAVSAENLFKLGRVVHRDTAATYQRLAKETVFAFEPEMLQYPYLFPGLLSSLVRWKVGEEDGEGS